MPSRPDKILRAYCYGTVVLNQFADKAKHCLRFRFPQGTLNNNLQQCIAILFEELFVGIIRLTISL